ncbi:hypothetical protein [Streptomyces sp. 35G-GA-8]|uniref:hypothetical protein n=1 Tax=Streptomyces sp. 35G-GA-8 TaxID=2939434 RepID=UPI00201F3C4D|nr:hypothetical protein [Streptomyces sp. 35G-GA-8]MCL7380232.1 hypothetical protein [Streptomyces sp. 35G-GA-8]
MTDDADYLAPTLIVGVHGVLDLEPWIRRAHEDDSLEEDMYSLVVKRTVAYGLSSFHAGGPEGERWGHNDAGGDWTQDGKVHQLAWLQVAVSEDLRGQRIPVQPAVTVLRDVLTRLGRFRPTGLHTLAPLQLAPDARADLVDAAAWFALADPDPATSVDLTVSVWAPETADLPDRASDLLTEAQERTYDAMTIRPAPPTKATTTAQDGLDLPLAGEVQAEGMRPGPAFHCRVHEWSLDVAAWTTEIFVDALRSTGTRAPALITVSAGERAH